MSSEFTHSEQSNAITLYAFCSLIAAHRRFVAFCEFYVAHYATWMHGGLLIATRCMSSAFVIITQTPANKNEGLGDVVTVL